MTENSEVNDTQEAQKRGPGRPRKIAFAPAKPIKLTPPAAGEPVAPETIAAEAAVASVLDAAESLQETVAEIEEKATSPAAKAAPPAAKKVAPAKGKAPKESTASMDASRAKRAEAARAIIFKTLGHKSIGEKKSPWPAVSAGSFLIDHMIGGTPSADNTGPKCPGYPRRHITEVYGAESSGKTTAALEAIAEAQRHGGLAMFLDFEHSLDSQYARRIGVRFERDYLLNYQPNTMEEGWRLLYTGLKAGVDIVVVDSIASMVPKDELEKKIDDPARIGAQARNMSQNLPKILSWLHDKKHSANPLGTAVIFINQTRATISAAAKGDNENTSGGRALKFYATIRLKFTRTGSAVVEKKNPFTGKKQSYPYGNYTKVKLVKSKVDGKQGLTANIFIRYNHGIDDYFSLVEAASYAGFIDKGGGGNYTINGEACRGMDRARDYLISHPVYFEELRNQVLNAVRDDTEVEDAEPTEEESMLQSVKTVFGDEDDVTSETADDVTFNEGEVDTTGDTNDGDDDDE